MALSAGDKTVFGKRRPPTRQSRSVPQTTLFKSEHAALVEYTREKHRKRSIGPQSVFEIYWPFYIGFGVPIVIYCIVIGYFIALSTAVPIAGVTSLIFVAPTVFIICFIVSVILTRSLASLNGAAQTTNSLFSWGQRSPGFRTGAVLGLTLFIIFEWSRLADLIEDFTFAGAAQTILIGLGFIGMTGAICRRIERFILRKHGMEVQESAVVQEAQQRISSYRLKIAPHWPLILAALCTGSAICFTMAAPLFFDLKSNADLSKGIGIFPAAFIIMWLYFMIFAKIIQKTSRLFGLVAHYQ